MEDPIFKGATRPPMVMGVPITPFAIAFGIIALVAAWSNIFVYFLMPCIFFIMRALAKKDDQIFRLMGLQFKFFAQDKAIKYWKVKSSSPCSYHKINIKKISEDIKDYEF